MNKIKELLSKVKDTASKITKTAVEKLKSITSKIGDGVSKAIKWFVTLPKKTKIISAVVAGTVVVGAGTGIVVANLHRHEYVPTVTVETCEEQGYTTYTCECGDSYISDYVSALGHTEVIDEAISATCTTDGKTEGKHCSVCSKTIVVQEVVSALGHVEVTDDAVAPTCTATGLTQGSHCSRCSETLVEQTVVDALGHNFVNYVSNGDATCTTNGTETAKCERCNETHTREDDESALGHVEVIDDAVAPTCTETGLTQGSHCSVCNKVIVAQTEVAATGHTDKLIASTESTCTKAGSETYTCIKCGDSHINELAKLPHTYPSTVGATPAACDNCGHLKPSEGLNFSAVSGGYSVTGIGSCKDSVIVIPETYNGKPVVEIGKNAFFFGGLTSVTIPESVKTIASGAFSFCVKLTSITIPNSVTSIGTQAFYSCDNLASVTIPDSVTSIGNQAFEYCKSLTSISIPNSVKKMGANVFKNCNNLRDIYIGFAIIPSTWGNTSGSWIADCSATVHYSLQCDQHTWQKATCTTPKTCTVCMFTQGDPIEHTWQSATCTKPKTCSYCGVTNGNPLGHSYSKPWSCTGTNTCSVCQETAVGHDWHAATCSKPKTCSKCNTTTGSPLTHILDQSGVCYFCYMKIQHTVSLDNNFGKTIYVSEGLVNFTIDGDLVGVANTVTIYGPVSNLVGTLTFYWDDTSVYTGDFVSGYTTSPLISGTYTVKFSYYSSYDLVVRGGKYVRVGKGSITTKTIYLQVK